MTLFSCLSLLLLSLLLGFEFDVECLQCSFMSLGACECFLVELLLTPEESMRRQKDTC